MAVGSNGTVAIVGGIAEQVRRRHRRDRLDRWVVQLSPHTGGVGPPPAKQQTMYRSDVPTCRNPHSGTDEGYRRLVGPPHPSGPQSVLDEAHDNPGALGRAP